MCAGQVPFPSPSLPEKLFAHQALEPTPLDQLVPGLPEGLAEVVQRMMRKSPDERYATPMQVVQALEPYADEASIIGNRESGSVLVQKPTAELRRDHRGLMTVRPPHCVNTGLSQLSSRQSPCLMAQKFPPVAATETGSGANADESTASLLSPVSDHDGKRRRVSIVPEPWSRTLAERGTDRGQSHDRWSTTWHRQPHRGAGAAAGSLLALGVGRPDRHGHGPWS